MFWSGDLCAFIPSFILIRYFLSLSQVPETAIFFIEDGRKVAAA